MSVSMKEVDPAFQGAGQKAGIEVWCIENSSPVAVPESSYGKFFTGETYMILKTNGSKSGSFRYDIHYWIGKDASEDEASAAAVKTLELDAALGGRSVQYRELQGNETERFLSCFKPCIIPEEAEPQEHKTRMFLCKGKHVVHVQEVPCARSSLNHDAICILDSKNKIFQFNGLNTSIQERAKALEVVQYIRDTYHRSKCDIATIDDGKLMADADSGEFWGFFGGFAPLPKKTTLTETQSTDTHPTRLFCVKKGQAERVAADSLTKKLLDTHICYLLDCGAEIYVWMGRSTSLEERKDANGAAEEYLRDQERPTSKIIRMIENFETVSFRSKFASWPKPGDVVASEEGRGKVAALLKRQGLDVKGLVKAAPPKGEEEEDPQAYIDCSGILQVWRVNGQEKSLLSEADQSKFYTGDCYIFQYTYSGDDQEECLIGTWFGKKSVTEDRDSAISQANKMVESFKFLAAQARIYEGSEPIMFYAIFQSFMVLKGGLSNGYKNYISENGLEDDTYKEDGVALFRVQGSGPENMQSIQVESFSSSLNSCYCYILHKDSLIFTWYGNQTNADDQDLAERQLDVIKPDMQTRVHKEGSESDQFWELLGGKKKHPAQKIPREAESDPHLFSCTLSKGEDLMVCEIHNFNQDDLMTEDVYILDCHTNIFLWVGQEVPSKTKTQALAIGQKFLERDVLIEYLSLQTPIYIIMEGSEPPFFTRFFKWDSKKFAVHGNSFQRKLSILKGGRSTMNLKPKKRAPVSFGGRSGSEKPQRSRSVTLSSDRPRARGRSPAFNAIASKFDSPGGRNLSTPPPQLYPKASGASEAGSGSGGGNVDASKLFTKSKAIASITASFDKPTREKLMPRSLKASSNSTAKSESNSKFNPHTIKEDAKENEVEDEEGVTLYPFDRLTTSSMDPAPDIDVTRREIYLSKADFREKFGMTKEAFYKLPKWRQNKIKISLKLF